MRAVVKECARTLGVIVVSVIVTFGLAVVIAYFGGFQVLAEVAR
ncbi:hypothetical protein [Williamsia deligens]|uniref:Uncharacterized protein n=1 Tax=Williamsia deligens TaxID=321325 RepID=A0ABW3G9T7_9NOCA|nr:hypothetical protein [Williamsia deligens]MCP2196335.1 hypothetical protein [Williamsia deligens]